MICLKAEGEGDHECAPRIHGDIKPVLEPEDIAGDNVISEHPRVEKVPPDYILLIDLHPVVANAEHETQCPQQKYLHFDLYR